MKTKILPVIRVTEIWWTLLLWCTDYWIVYINWLFIRTQLYWFEIDIHFQVDTFFFSRPNELRHSADIALTRQAPILLLLSWCISKLMFNNFTLIVNNSETNTSLTCRQFPIYHCEKFRVFLFWFLLFQTPELKWWKFNSSLWMTLLNLQIMPNSWLALSLSELFKPGFVCLIHWVPLRTSLVRTST